jgi:uncharacterized protein with PIN domain
LSEYRYVLDTYAILTVIEDEPGAQTVAEIMTTQGATLYLSMISLGEVYYILLRRRGEQAAEEVTQNTLAEQSLVLVDVTWTKEKMPPELKR